MVQSYLQNMNNKDAVFDFDKIFQDLIRTESAWCISFVSVGLLYVLYKGRDYYVWPFFACSQSDLVQ